MTIDPEKLREGFALIMRLNVQVCQNDTLHRFVRKGELSALGPLYDWAYEMNDLIQNESKSESC